jgi:hypothetical protein
MADPKQFENFPAEPRTHHQWVVFRNELVKGKVTRVPYQPQRQGDGKFYRASSTDPSTWSTFLEAVECFQNPNNRMDGIGYVFAEGVLGLDLDDCLDKNILPSLQALGIIKDLPRSYTEASPSGKGLHIFWRCKYVVDPGVNVKCKLSGLDGAEVYTQERFFTVTGDKYKLSQELCDLTEEQAKTLVNRVKALKPLASKIEVVSRHDDLNKLGFKLYKANCSPDVVEAAIRAQNKTYAEPKDEAEVKRVLHDLKEDAKRGKITPNAEIDPDSWREGFYSFGQLPKTPPRFVLGGLIPEKAFTAICAASYNCKTWLALMMALAISTGRSLWCFDGPSEPVPVAYYVPEMNAALIRNYLQILGCEDSEMFLVRPMEEGLWALDDPRMLRSSEGRMVFLDTAGYFNPADDSSSYQQSLKFANLLYNLLQNGAIAVAGLFHPPKSASQENQPWTLENSILGSAGYGGMLRSCLRMKNLNPDLNDENVWVYVQGMKNPGLKPFQLMGPPPLEMKVPPGESPYLKDLDFSVVDPRRELAFKGFKDKKSHKVLAKELKVSLSTLTDWREEWVLLDQSQPQDLAGDPSFKVPGITLRRKNE